jgi:hypothetical protein
MAMARDAEWNPAEDMRPGPRFQKVQPEKTPRGDVWVFVVKFRSVHLKPEEHDLPCYMQMMIRFDGNDYITTEGRIYSPPREDEDGA